MEVEDSRDDTYQHTGCCVKSESRMSLKRLIDVNTVAQLLKNNIINKEGVRILDCTYDHSLVKKKPDWKHFQKELYGKFEKLLAHPCP
ncbi:hypothetical protein TELCIR_06142 [Teladorsagia circumcincta]|uniref:Uncharacterized protein n=1 Tax=Teladorsagia circumcincta TaxID=45464 RepID=A0A2G9UQF0_TELCI|nr:hypothetical protein TELCIR_06142 [Teladorsagia circumcincta]